MQRANNPYLLQKSTTPGHWVFTDTAHGVVIIFEEGKFNDTQKITLLNEDEAPDALTLARIVREMSEWLAARHPKIVFGGKYGIRRDGDGHLVLCRFANPKWELKLDEPTPPAKLASSLRKAAEWLVKGPTRENDE